jgi:hypothetical protein
MSHKIILPDGSEINIVNRDEQDYVDDWRPETIEKERKDRLRRDIYHEVSITQWKKIPKENHVNIVKNIIEFFTGYPVGHPANDAMTKDLMEAYPYYFK